ncbi:methyltransferase [Noviherbaspirillum suwonense]|uniref:Methyltransferase small domain-containing protein n=1 Tax=Noviherbaspirillum suwonense TaxID=1224511 RepID=A0ABY1Q8A5_9BURK|nr:methyltransferase [Noviherbaspirillum suwonense]SMP59058.1 Methyltransferase small domain-containing protein [Noviherbaspirillum suwonense]
MNASTPLSGDDAALNQLLAHLRAQDYRFRTITPLSHAHVLARRDSETGSTLRDLFGWNLPVGKQLLPAALASMLVDSAVLESDGRQWRSKLRVSSIDDALFLHSAYPTEQEDAVFFGPDTYRFVRFMRQALANRPLASGARILDIGCGSGAGGLMLARQCEEADLVLNDINPLALRYSRLNAKGLGLRATLAMGGSLAVVDGQFDLIIANPPYLVDKEARTYRHGGDDLGRSLGLRMVTQAVTRLAPGGRLLFYTGVAIVDGRDPLLAELAPILDGAGLDWRYDEIDPDVFGEELLEPAYHEVDRIAAIGLEAWRKPD